MASAWAYRIVWVWNSLMAMEDAESRQERIEKAYLRIEQLQTKLQGRRCRLRLRERVGESAEKILAECGAGRWMRAEITERKEPVYRQEKRGRPGDNTKYLRQERLRFSVAARVKEEVIIADERSDGMFPLITNSRDLTCKEILAAYKFQPSLEKRHEQLKTVQDLAPVWLKNVSRIEALLFLYFIALLVHALLEREQVRDEERGCVPALHDQYCVEDIRARRSKVQPLRGVAEQFRPGLDDRDERVAEPFAFGGDACDRHEVDARSAGDLRSCRGRNDPAPGLYGSHCRFRTHTQRLMPFG